MLYEIIESKGTYFNNDKNRFKFMFLFMLLLFSRRNAIIIIMVLIVILFIKYRKYYKYYILVSLFSLFIYNLNLFLPSNYPKTGLYQESVSVPIQQISYVIKYKNIDEKDRKFLDNIMYTDTINEIYNPFMVDNIKWNQLFNGYYLTEHKYEFNDIWFKYLKKYPKEYMKAYILNTYSLWSINEYLDYESSFYYINSGYRSLHNEIILPKKIYNSLNKFYTKYNKYINNGSLLWIYILLMLIIIYKNKKEYIILFIPFITLWLNHMVATPLSSALRYMSPLGYALPFIIGIVFYKEDKKVL